MAFNQPPERESSCLCLPNAGIIGVSLTCLIWDHNGVIQGSSLYGVLEVWWVSEGPRISTVLRFMIEVICVVYTQPKHFCTWKSKSPSQVLFFPHILKGTFFFLKQNSSFYIKYHRDTLSYHRSLSYINNNCLYDSLASLVESLWNIPVLM